MNNEHPINIPEPRMERYNPHAIEKKWQTAWEQSGLYKFDEDAPGEKFYALTMFPYPSGNLHIGHWYNFAPADSWGRYMRMKGFNVFEPQGYDSFGLPAEQHAITTGIHPRVNTESNIANMRRQLRRLAGFGVFDRALRDSRRFEQSEELRAQLFGVGDQLVEVGFHHARGNRLGRRAVPALPHHEPGEVAGRHQADERRFEKQRLGGELREEMDPGSHLTPVWDQRRTESNQTAPSRAASCITASNSR